MYSKIIVPIAMDQLEHGEKVLTRAQSLLDDGGEIILLNVVEDLNAYAQGYMIVDFPLELIEASRDHAKKDADRLSGKAWRQRPCRNPHRRCRRRHQQLCRGGESRPGDHRVAPAGTDRLFHRLHRHPRRQSLQMRRTDRPLKRLLLTHDPSTAPAKTRRMVV